MLEENFQLTPGLGFVFPGQGSQKVGMLADYAESHDVVSQAFVEASEALGFDLWKLIQEGPLEELTLTHNAQPALLASGVAIWRLWLEKGGAIPAYMAGHSLGEWTALVAAGVVEFSEALKLVRSRGEYMQSAVPVGIGAMAAIIGLDDDGVLKACAESGQGEEVSAVNFNSPGQVVIAGHKDAVNRAIEKASELGAKRGMLLPVSAPFHTSLMRPAADRLAEDLDKVAFSAPKVPVIQNVGVQAVSDPEIIKAKVIEQIYSPVPWVATVQALSEFGVSTLVECGPGKVLSGLNKRINKGLTLLSTDAESGFSSALESV